MKENVHKPVLLDQTLHYLAPKKGDKYLDLTAGYGGHAGQVLDLIGKQGTAVLVDRDEQAINHLAERFADDKRVQMVHDDFYTASVGLKGLNMKFDCILADIGVSSPHLDNPDRGFSFMKDGPLDMRMDKRQTLKADAIVNDWSVDQLANVLYDFGEVRGSRRIARYIVEHRPVHTTNELAKIIQNCTKPTLRTKVCSQVFQALRIVVNDEIGLLARSLPEWKALLAPEGRLAVITFHSLEDRIVKRFFAEHGGDRFDADLNILTKRAVSGTEQEIVNNPRARSAKLRAVQRK